MEKSNLTLPLLVGAALTLLGLGYYMTSKQEAPTKRDDLIKPDVTDQALKLEVKAQVKRIADTLKTQIRLVDGQMKKLDYLRVQALVEIMCKANRAFHLQS
jgi:hypothetical protein